MPRTDLPCGLAPRAVEPADRRQVYLRQIAPVRSVPAPDLDEIRGLIRLASSRPTAHRAARTDRRYRAGDFEPVWRELRELGAIDEPDIREEASIVAVQWRWLRRSSTTFVSLPP